MDKKLYHAEWYKRNRESELAKANANRKANPDSKRSWLALNGHKPKVRFSHAKSKTRIRKKGWSLTFEQYEKLIANPCFYCGSSIEYEKGCGLDRLDNSKGYELSNVVPCCYRCNTGRSNNFTPEEWKIGISAILAFRNKVE